MTAISNADTALYGSFPFVTDAVAAGLQTLHGAFVEIGTGALLFHRGDAGFVAV